MRRTRLKKIDNFVQSHFMDIYPKVDTYGHNSTVANTSRCVWYERILDSLKYDYYLCYPFAVFCPR